MKRTSLRPNILFVYVVLLCLPSLMLAQSGCPTPSLSATVTQVPRTNTNITIIHSWPGVKCRTIWCKHVPYDILRPRGAEQKTTL